MNWCFCSCDMHFLKFQHRNCIAVTVLKLPHEMPGKSHKYAMWHQQMCCVRIHYRNTTLVRLSWLDKLLAKIRGGRNVKKKRLQNGITKYMLYHLLTSSQQPVIQKLHPCNFDMSLFYETGCAFEMSKCAI